MKCNAVTLMAVAHFIRSNGEISVRLKPGIGPVYGIKCLQKGAYPGYFARNANAVGNQAGHHIHGIVVGNRGEIIHLAGSGLPPAPDAHGIALKQAGIDIPIGMGNQAAIRRILNTTLLVNFIGGGAPGRDQLPAVRL